MENSIILIPAYNPTKDFIELIKTINKKTDCDIVVINDGSKKELEYLFDPREYDQFYSVVHHATNLGKGAALKTGINHILIHYPEAGFIVTADADGQHLPKDIAKICHAAKENAGTLVLGSRKGLSDVPLRSKFGNTVTKYVMKFIGGLNISDTQTGLRAIPSTLGKILLSLKTSGYDFELDMLLTAKNFGVDIIEETITKVYIDENASSHFNPFFDSLKIYLVFLRFNISSLISVLIDYSIFSISLVFGISLFSSQFLARFCAGAVNYFINRSFVFKSDINNRSGIARYSITLILLGLLSYIIIKTLAEFTGMNIFLAKVLAESFLYIISFMIQRDFIFKKTNFIEL